MANDPTTPEPYDALAPGVTPLDPEAELALQDELAGAIVASPPVQPVPIGRTWAYDFASRRFIPDGAAPINLRGIEALRQRVEKCLRTERGAALVHTAEYGMEAVYDLLDGSPFEGSEYAELEERVRDALVALPGIRDVDDYQVEYERGDDAVFVSFLVVAEDEELNADAAARRFDLELPVTAPA